MVTVRPRWWQLAVIVVVLAGLFIGENLVRASDEWHSTAGVCVVWLGYGLAQLWVGFNIGAIRGGDSAAEEKSGQASLAELASQSSAASAADQGVRE